MQSIKNILPSALAGLNQPETQKKQKLWTEWNKIVGEQIAKNTRPSLGKQGELFIWTDQPALAHELITRYQPTILRRVQALLGQEEVKKIIIRVGQLR